MARSVTVGTTWTQLTTADATAVRIQNLGISPLFVKAVQGATPPTNRDGAVMYAAGEGDTSDVTLAAVFAEVSGANRLYAIREFGSGEVSVSQT